MAASLCVGLKAGMPPIWTVHRRPRDMPDCAYVVRVYYGPDPEPNAVPFPNLQAARTAIVQAGGSYCLGRRQDADPDVVESWI